eukprot:scaffold39594_cov16-Tisochrysis_lutea.AAC.1
MSHAVCSMMIRHESPTRLVPYLANLEAQGDLILLNCSLKQLITRNSRKDKTEPGPLGFGAAKPSHFLARPSLN